MSATAFDDAWELTPADRLVIEAKRWGGRLRFAVMLLFHRAIAFGDPSAKQPAAERPEGPLPARLRGGQGCRGGVGGQTRRTVA